MIEPKVKCVNCSGKDCKLCGGMGEFVGIAISNAWPTIKSERIKELEKEIREFEIPKPSVILQVGGKKPPGYLEPQSSAPAAPSTPTTSKMDENEHDRLELARRSRPAPTPSIVCVTTPEFEAAELIALARSKPDEGAGGGDHCPHGIRYPWECKECADACVDAAWDLHRRDYESRWGDQQTAREWLTEQWHRWLQSKGKMNLLSDVIYPVADRAERAEVSASNWEEYSNYHQAIREEIEVERDRLREVLEKMLHLCEHDLGMDEENPYIELARAALKQTN